ncbi:hypothetical protein DFH09DRAFT_1081669 [Mycena vulgaris]|nr:hypothetical protein DFH09DRAFT_1081669 [Mycena vulgaris]
MFQIAAHSQSPAFSAPSHRELRDSRPRYRDDHAFILMLPSFENDTFITHSSSPLTVIFDLPDQPLNFRSKWAIVSVAFLLPSSPSAAPDSVVLFNHIHTSSLKQMPRQIAPVCISPYSRSLTGNCHFDFGPEELVAIFHLADQPFNTRSKGRLLSHPSCSAPIIAPALRYTELCHLSCSNFHRNQLTARHYALSMQDGAPPSKVNAAGTDRCFHPLGLLHYFPTELLSDISALTPAFWPSCFHSCREVVQMSAIPAYLSLKVSHRRKHNSHHHVTAHIPTSHNHLTAPLWCRAARKSVFDFLRFCEELYTLSHCIASRRLSETLLMDPDWIFACPFELYTLQLSMAGNSSSSSGSWASTHINSNPKDPLPQQALHPSRAAPSSGSRCWGSLE